MFKTLPANPNIHHLKKQAKDLFRDFKKANQKAINRVKGSHPKHRGTATQSILDTKLGFQDMLLVIAREYGFLSWARITSYIQSGDNPAYLDAVQTIDNGDERKLKSILTANPNLVHERINLKDATYGGYFTAPTLLHHVAGNPIRCKLPKNAVRIARILLDAGADVDAQTLNGDWSWTTLGLVASGREPVIQSIVEPMIDTLINAGADVNWNNGITMYGALFHAFEYQRQIEAAEHLLARGAKVDLCFASALGNLELVEGFFSSNGNLIPEAYSLYRITPDRMGNPSSQEIMEEAFVWSCFNNQKDIAGNFLEKGIDINSNPSVAGSRATALHRAALAGWQEMVEFLLERGADLTIKDSMHQGTPLNWAKHQKQDKIAEILLDAGAT